MENFFTDPNLGVPFREEAEAKSTRWNGTARRFEKITIEPAAAGEKADVNVADDEFSSELVRDMQDLEATPEQRRSLTREATDDFGRESLEKKVIDQRMKRFAGQQNAGQQNAGQQNQERQNRERQGQVQQYGVDSEMEREDEPQAAAMQEAQPTADRTEKESAVNEGRQLNNSFQAPRGGAKVGVGGALDAGAGKFGPTECCDQGDALEANPPYPGDPASSRDQARNAPARGSQARGSIGAWVVEIAALATVRRKLVDSFSNFSSLSIVIASSCANAGDVDPQLHFRDTEGSWNI